MTFPDFISDAQARGFSHVVTCAGPVALGDWHPYGLFGGVNSRPGCPVERNFRLHWTDNSHATDASDDLQAPFVAGLWQFVRLP